MHTAFFERQHIACIPGNPGKVSVRANAHVISVRRQPVEHIPVEAVAELAAANVVAVYAPEPVILLAYKVQIGHGAGERDRPFLPFMRVLIPFAAKLAVLENIVVKG